MTTIEITTALHQIWTEANTFNCYECDTPTDDAMEHRTIDMQGMDDDYHFCSEPCADAYDGRNGRW